MQKRVELLIPEVLVVRFVDISVNISFLVLTLESDISPVRRVPFDLELLIRRSIDLENLLHDFLLLIGSIYLLI